MRSDLTRQRGRNGTGGMSRGEGDARFGMVSESEASHLLAPSRQPGSVERAARVLPLVQGGYYLATGLWPLVHMDSFERVTGKKSDRWLVRTVGTLAAAIGSGLLQAGRRGYLPRELRTVSQLAAIGFMVVEVPTALRGRISPVYLADAAVELGFLGASVWAARKQDDGGEQLDILARKEARAALDPRLRDNHGTTSQTG